MTLPEARKVTHEMARKAYFELHNALYCGGPVPTLTIPRSLNDVDCILCDYIEQQEELDRLPVDHARLQSLGDAL